MSVLQCVAVCCRPQYFFDPPVMSHAKELCSNHYGVATVSRVRLNYRSLLQNIVSFIRLFCKRDL